MKQTDVRFLRIKLGDQQEYSAVGDTGSVSYGKPASLVAGSTTMATFAREFHSLFLDEDGTLSFFNGGEIDA